MTRALARAALIVNGTTCENGYDVLALDPEYDRSCPCATIKTPNGTYSLHCWRVCMECEGCGIHYTGASSLAWAMKSLLDAMDWYGEWNVVEGSR